MKALQALNKFLWKYKWRLFCGFILIFATNLVSIFSLFYIRDGINTIEEAVVDYRANQLALNEIKNSLLWIALTFVGLTVLAGIINIGVRLLIIATSRHIEFDLKNEIYQQYQSLSLSFYKKNKTGDLMNRITEDVSFVRMYLGPGIMYPINLFSIVVIIVTAMIQIDWRLTLYTLAPLPILSFLIYKVAITINKKSKVLQEQQSNLSSTVQDTFSGIRVIKSFNTEKSTQAAYKLEAKEYKKRALSLALTQAYFGPLMILVVGVSNLLILYIGGTRYIEGKLDIGAVALFFMFLNKLIWPFTALGWVTMLVQRAEASMARINEFLNEKPEIKNTVAKHTPIDGKIIFNKVNFIYKNTGIQALKNISFTLEKGETLAILGKTGSGKTTIALLLARLLRPTDGEILIDDVAYEKLNLNSLREAIGFVPQEAFLFSDTIENNILFGVENKTLDDAKLYAKKAAVHDNIVAFKNQYQTILGERGVTLSGGQKQRLSIARALIKEPNILVFDDSLSAVDTETEEQIFNNLHHDLNQKTTVIITHRISSAKNADKILVLENGEIIEFGSHDSLMENENYYYNLYLKQLTEQE